MVHLLYECWGLNSGHQLWNKCLSPPNWRINPGGSYFPLSTIRSELSLAFKFYSFPLSATWVPGIKLKQVVRFGRKHFTHWDISTAKRVGLECNSWRILMCKSYLGARRNGNFYSPVVIFISEGLPLLSRDLKWSFPIVTQEDSV